MDLQPTETEHAKSDDSLIDGAFIESDLGIARRSRCNYRRRGVLPPPDTNLLGRNLWCLSTYRRFKDDLMAGKFVKVRRPPSRRAVRQDPKPPTESPCDPSPFTSATLSANGE